MQDFQGYPRKTIVILIPIVLIFGALTWLVRNILISSKISSGSEYFAGSGRWRRIAQYYFAGPEVVDEHYKRVSNLFRARREIVNLFFGEKGSKFIETSPNHGLVLMTSPAQARELSEAPETHLSLHGVAKDMFQPQYTMYGFVVHDQPTANGSMHARILRTLLTSNLSKLMPALHDTMDKALDKELEKGVEQGGGWIDLSTFSLARNLVSRINSRMFVGESLANNSEYIEAAGRYPQDVFVMGEILQITPKAMAPLVVSIMTKNQRAQKTMLKHLFPLVEERLSKCLYEDEREDRPLDCIQWIIDTAPKLKRWDAKRIIQEALALWFGSVHQLAMSLVYALYDLCDHPEYIEMLRRELAQTGDNWHDKLDRLQLLDSFLRESARLNPSDSISVRRKALKPYTMADGTTVPQGSWACVPQRAILRDPIDYNLPATFNGLRFLDGKAGYDCPKPGPLTDVDEKFPLWGLGKRTCPGRFYAANALKMMVGHIVDNYDVKLQDYSVSRTFTWRSATIPRSSAKLSLRIRKV